MVVEDIINTEAFITLLEVTLLSIRHFKGLMKVLVTKILLQGSTDITEICSVTEILNQGNLIWITAGIKLQLKFIFV